jgi:hypothetical protein
MNMRNYQILHLRHKFKNKNKTFIVVLHFTVTIGSSMIAITHTAKWVGKKIFAYISPSLCITSPQTRGSQEPV